MTARSITQMVLAAIIQPPHSITPRRLGSRYATPLATVVLVVLFLIPAKGSCQYWIYTVRPGDNIWNVTEDYLIDIHYWRKLQQLNEVTDPEHLPPGSRLRLPVAWLKTQPTTVRVLKVQGEAKAMVAATGQYVPVTVGLLLQAGDEIHTGPDGNLTLEFGDGSQLLLLANSHLTMDTLSAYRGTGMVDTRLRLQRGQGDSQVKPRQEGEPRFEIQTPAAVSAVRGTGYRVSMEADQRLSRTEVLDGVVAVSGSGKTRRVPAKFGTLAKAGKPPEPPIRLLPPPVVAALPPVVERVPIRLSLPALAGAVAYRAQIAPNQAFETLLFDGATNSPNIKGPDLPDGNYVLRVRGIDPQGLGGLDAYHSFTLHARPEPPLLISPKHGATVLDEFPALQWSEPVNAVGYHLQLANNESFHPLLIDRPAYTGAHFTPEPLPKPGVYYWRLATLNAAGQEGPFSDLQRFRLQLSNLEPPVMEESAVILRWSAGPPGQRYQIQVARDSGFDNVVVDTMVSQPQLRMPYPESGFYYLRLRTVETDGSLGSYGPTQRITVPPRSYWPFAIFTVVMVLLAL